MSTPVPRIYFNIQLMEPRLRRLFGIGVEDLQSVGGAALRAFVAVSALHPKGYNGTSAWAEATSQVRALLIPHGWVPRDPQNQPRIVSGDGQLAITVSSGTPDTGVPDGNPQTRNDKGAQTASSVQNWMSGRILVLENLAQDIAQQGAGSNVPGLVDQPSYTSNFQFT